MSFDIRFDYRFDEANFFTSERRAIIEQAGDIWSSYIRDNFTSIPTEETLTFSIDNVNRDIILEESIDDVLIFVSSVELDSDFLTLGEGSFFGDFIVGSDREERLIGEDFEPWLGTIEFNINAEDTFFFDSSPETINDIPADKQDFLTISLHEIGHVLGIGTAPTFSNQIQDNTFTGASSVTLNNSQPVPLDQDHTHIEEGFTVNSETDTLLDRSLTFGERNLPTSLDLAILSDIGYDVATFDRTEVYRFFRFDRGFHFYTADQNEQEVVRELSDAGDLPYDYERIAYDVLASDKDILTGAEIEGATPVFRFFNRTTGAHLYTMDENERDFIRDNLSAFDFENEAYYAFESEPVDIETVPLYRMLNTQTNTHLFTTDINEFNFLRDNQPQFQIEGNGGITFHVLETI